MLLRSKESLAMIYQDKKISFNLAIKFKTEKYLFI